MSIITRPFPNMLTESCLKDFYLAPSPDCRPDRTDKKKIEMQTQIPSVLIENFIWDWVYDEYTDRNNLIPCSGLPYPVCTSDTPCQSVEKSEHPDRISGKKLKIPANRKVVLTMGGIPEQYAFLKELTNECAFYNSGQSICTNL